MSSTIELRAARPSDAQAVAAYHQRCFADTFASLLAAGRIEPPDLDGTLQQLRGWFEPGSGFDSRVAVLRGDLVGHVTVRAHQLVHLFVDPPMHGQGIGIRLLRKGESLIAAAGHDVSELHARVENDRAIGFYQAFGWERTDQRITTVDHGIAYDEWVLTKSLVNRR